MMGISSTLLRPKESFCVHAIAYVQWIHPDSQTTTALAVRVAASLDETRQTSPNLLEK